MENPVSPPTQIYILLEGRLWSTEKFMKNDQKAAIASSLK